MARKPNLETDAEESTRFLNVDLDIFSRVPLDPIATAFGEKTVVLHVGKWGRRYSAHFELADSGYVPPTASAATIVKQADRLIRRFVGLVERLPLPARRLWNQAHSREFNIGIEAAARSPLFEQRLEPGTIDAVARVNGRIVITVYAPERLLRPAAVGSRRKRSS